MPSGIIATLPQTLAVLLQAPSGDRLHGDRCLHPLSPRDKMRNPVLLSLVLLASFAGVGYSQAVSAAINSVEESRATEANRSWQDACNAITQIRDTIGVRTDLAPKAQAAFNDALAGAIALGKRCAGHQTLPVTAIGQLISNLDAIEAAAGEMPVSRATIDQLRAFTSAPAHGGLLVVGAVISPSFGALEPTVGFTAGVGVTPAAGGQAEIAVGSNLLGYVVQSAATTLFGDSDFFKYLNDNLIIGAGFPLNDGGISTQLGLALGGIGTRVSFWPALSIIAVDTADARVPDSLHGKAGTSGTYSSPVLSMSVIPRSQETISDLILSHKPVFAFTVSVGFPYYRAGDLIGGLGALFTDPGGFHKVGRPVLSLSASVPFVRLDKKKQDAKTGGEKGQY